MIAEIMISPTGNSFVTLFGDGFTAAWWMFLAALLTNLPHLLVAFVSRHLLESLLIGGVGAGVVYLVQNRLSASTRHLIAVSALAFALGWPLFATLAPKLWTLSIRSDSVSELKVEQIPPVNLPPPVEATDTSTGKTDGPSESTPPSVANATPVTPPSSPSLKNELLPPDLQGISGLELLIFFITLGTLTSLTFFLLCHLICFFRFAFSSSLDHPAWEAATESARSQLGIRRKIRLVASNRCSVPVTFGLFRPRIVVPDEARNWGSSRIEVTALHEAAHIKRLDVLWQAFGRFAAAVQWWNPFAWILLRQIRESSEEACDNLVVLNQEDPEAYADMLVAIARHFRRQRFPQPELGIVSRQRFSRRIETILDQTVARNRFGKRSVLAVSLTSLALAATSLFAIARVPANAPMWIAEDRVILSEILDEIERARTHFPPLSYAGVESKTIKGSTHLETRFTVRSHGPDLHDDPFRADFSATLSNPNPLPPDKTIWSDGTHGIRWLEGGTVQEGPRSITDLGRVPAALSLLHTHGFTYSEDGQKHGGIETYVRMALSGSLSDPAKGDSVSLTSVPYQGTTAIRLDVITRGTIQSQWWLDPARNYALLASRNDRFGHAIEVTSFHSIGEGFWFPAELSYTQHRRGNLEYEGVIKVTEASVANTSVDLSKASVLASLGREETKKSLQRQASSASHGKSITVTVVDDETGDPIPGVGVWVDLNDDRSKKKSNDLGEISLNLSTVDSPVTFLRFWIQHEGYVGLRETLTSSRDPRSLPTTHTLALAKGATLSGKVEDEEGRGIADAKIEFLFNDLPIWQPNTITGKDGRWKLNTVPKDFSKLNIRVSHPSYAQDTYYSDYKTRTGQPLASLSDGSSRIIMSAGSRIRGTVTDRDGQPVVGARVVLGKDRWGSNYPETKTDELGRYDIGNAVAKDRIHPGILTVQAEGFSPDIIELPNVIPRTGFNHDFQLQPGNQLQVRIVDESGQPLSGVKAVADRWRYQSRSLDKSFLTDENGLFSWRSAPEDEVKFDLLGKNVVLRRLPLTASGGVQEVILRPAIQFLGMVSDQRSGKPLPKFTVVVGRKQDHDDYVVWEDNNAKEFSDGQFELPVSTFGFHYQLRIEADGYQPTITEFHIADTQKVSLDLALDPEP